MNRFVRALALNGALMILTAPLVLQAQDRYAFGYLDGGRPANDGYSYLTINTTTLNTSNRGKYFSTGATDNNSNFRSGLSPTEGNVNGFYAFNLGNFSSTAISSASLTLFNCSLASTGCGGAGFTSPNASENFSIFDFTGSIAALVGGTGGVAAFNDLGSGSIFGTRSISNADNGQFVTFNFNAAGVAALTAARGGQFAVGSALGTAPTNVVPEPLPSALFACGLVVIGALVRRRRHA